jgi:hypothetical protein
MEHLQATLDPKEQQKANIDTNRAKKIYIYMQLSWTHTRDVESHLQNEINGVTMLSLFISNVFLASTDSYKTSKDSDGINRKRTAETHGSILTTESKVYLLMTAWILLYDWLNGHYYLNQNICFSLHRSRVTRHKFCIVVCCF